MKDTCFHGIGLDGDCEMCRDIITAIRPSDRSPSPSPDASLLEARSLVARLAAAEARADKAEAQLRSRDAEVYYLRLHREWAHDKRRQMASGAGVDAYQQWLAANPEPQPPDGCAP